MMTRQRRQFPLIPDGESCLQEPIVMRLYDNEDLITNIRSPYQDKDYEDLFPNFDFLPAEATAKQYSKGRVATRDEGISYAEKARMDAKRDVREKRQKFLQQEVQTTKRVATRSLPTKPATPSQPSVSDVAVTKAETPVTASVLDEPVKALKRTLSPKGKHSKIHRLADRLQQDTYILAEVAPVYQQPNNPSRKEIKKNSYDFLKRSQVYNYPERQQHREHQVAQELNLTQLEDAN